MQNKRKTKLILAGISLTLASFLVSGINSVSVSAYSASITTSNSISLDASPADDGTTIHSESINVQSDCRAGYNLTIATPEGSDLYKYSEGVPAATASFTAVDGTSALNSSNNANKWGYTLTSNPTSATVFSPLSATASVLKTPSQTASPSSDINDTFNINYGVKTDLATIPGTYSMASNGTILYYLTMDTTCTQYTVAFNANGGTGSINNQTIEVGEETKLTSSDSLTAPTGASYTDAGNNTISGDADKIWTFWGWNTQIDGTGDWYKDKEAVEDIVGAGTTLTLYAQWKQATLADMVAGTQIGSEKVIDHNLMQDMKPEVCYNSPITTASNAPAATLLDYRGKVTTGASPEQPEEYTVSKLADGLCWMTTNLNLGRASGGPNGDGTITLTSDDTDLADNATFTLPVHTTTSSTSATAAVIRTTNTSGNNDNGTYYSWPAAVAYTTSTSAILGTSICPKNWDLPTSNQFTNLMTKADYKTDNLTTSGPSSFLVDGGFTNGSNFYQTSYSHFWTNTSSSTTVAYGARVNGTTITTSASTGTTYGGNKYYRKNIRCVANQGRVTINYASNGTDEYPVTGSVPSQENVELVSTHTQPGTNLNRAGWYFNGWNTAADGSGNAIAANALIDTLNLKPGDTITLYAQWIPQYTITYINNCLTYINGNENCTQNVSEQTSAQSINISSTGSVSGTLASYNNGNTWNITGWKIAGWSIVADNSSNTNTEYRSSSSYYITGVSTNAPSGITLYAHWVPIYSIQYDGNGSDNDSTGMGSTDSSTGLKSVRHTNVAEGDTFDLFASNFKKAGHGFVGWSTDANAWSKLTDNDATNDAKIWGPNEIITAPAYNGTPITTLYAIWAPAEISGGSPVYLQNWEGCSTMTATTYDSTTGTLTVAKDSITALTDERDGEVYTIAKLADENCWMVENLRLADAHEESGSTVATTLTTTNTNILASNNTLPITNIYNADPSLATTSNSLSPTSSQNSTNDPSYGWCTTNSAACDDQSRLNTTNTIANITPSQTQIITSANAHTNFYNTIYAYGNYYNWHSATAGYGTYSRNIFTPTDGDLCPAGWHLPYGNNGTGTKGGNTSGGFYYLANRMTATINNTASSNKFRTFPNNFIYAGGWTGGSASNRGNSGYYWTASAHYNNNALNLTLSSTNINPGNGTSHKYDGNSVRCVADGTYTIQYNGNDATGGNMVSDSEELKHAGLLGGETIDLYPSNYYKTGYGFAGWSTDSDAWNHFTDNDVTNDPVIYGPMETITAPAHPGNRIMTLYAVWVPAEEDGNNNPVYLQDFDNTSCSGLTSTTFDSNTGTITVNKNSVIALTDKRDSNVYTVARLADGNCWMTENLRLGAANTVGNNQYDSSITNESLAQGYGGVFTGLDSTENSNFTSTTNATPNNMYNSAIITGDSLGYRFPRYNSNNTNTGLTASYNGTGSTTYYSWYSYGNYYTWAAAMANTASYGSATGASGSESAGTSLCPTNWTLPTSSDASKDLGMLSQSYGGTGDIQNGVSQSGDVMDNRFRSFPNNLLYSGYFNGSSVSDRGTTGVYWSRSAYSYERSRNLYLSSSYLNPYNIQNRANGLSVRCLIGN